MQLKRNNCKYCHHNVFTTRIVATYAVLDNSVLFHFHVFILWRKWDIFHKVSILFHTFGRDNIIIFRADILKIRLDISRPSGISKIFYPHISYFIDKLMCKGINSNTVILINYSIIQPSCYDIVYFTNDINNKLLNTQMYMDKNKNKKELM